MKGNRFITIIILVATVFFGGAFFVFNNKVFAANNATINATIKISVCGNDIKEGGEQCDGADFGGTSCITLGYTTGALACAPACEIDSSDCSGAPSPPTPPPATGGGGGVSYFFSLFTPPKPPAKSPNLNKDGKIDILDFSILLYHFSKSVDPSSSIDLNSDGRVDIVDVSIMLYHWKP